MNRKTGRKMRIKDMPLAFMDTNSKLSDRFPKVIKPATITVIGSAIGTKSANESPINFSNTRVVMPLPTNSSMYFQRNCIKNRNKLSKNVTAKSRTYMRRMSTSMRFTAQR